MDEQQSAYPTTVAADLLGYGEECDWLVAEGHRDLADFERVATAYCRDLGYGDDYELPEEPRHRWMRPARREDFPDDPAEWERAQAEDWQMWRDEAEDGAAPITIVGTL